jgi:hypothetical protein
MRTHVCPTCGHVVKHDSKDPIRVEHLPDGGHRWSVFIRVGLSFGSRHA